MFAILLPFLFLIMMMVLYYWVSANFASLKGSLGEKQISKLLQSLDPDRFVLLNDLYIPRENGTTTQIDHLLISDKGLFVIETKKLQWMDFRLAKQQILDTRGVL